jgi:hypothetical protein
MVDQQEHLRPAKKSRKKRNHEQVPGSRMRSIVGKAAASISQDKFQSSSLTEKNGDDISGASSFFADGSIYSKSSLIVSAAIRFCN